MIFLIKRISIQ